MDISKILYIFAMKEKLTEEDIDRFIRALEDFFGECTDENDIQEMADSVQPEMTEEKVIN